MRRQEQDWQGRIERLGWGGVGVGRLAAGRIVLLRTPLALFPGELVAARIALHARHAEGFVVEWLERDPRRVPAACPFAATCGGCSLWESGTAAGELKWLMVQDLLARQLRDAPPCLWLPSPPDTLRSRVQLAWDGATLGFHRLRSDELVPVDCCPMAAGPVSDAVPALRTALADGKLPAGSDRWELATGTPAGDVVATATGQPGAAWKLDQGMWRPNRDPLEHLLGNVRFQQQPGAFFQVCPAWAWQSFGELFGKWELAGDKLADLYGGSGFFSLLLAGAFNQSVIVESSRDSCLGAAANIEANREGLAGLRVSIECADVAEWLARAPDATGGPGLPENSDGIDQTSGVGEAGDVMLLDPPRAGLPRLVAEKLQTAVAGTIVLIGCDGMSFCRDVRRLAPRWQLDKLAAIDLFPNTPQVELVGLLRR